MWTFHCDKSVRYPVSLFRVSFLFLSLSTYFTLVLYVVNTLLHFVTPLPLHTVLYKCNLLSSLDFVYQFLKCNSSIFFSHFIWTSYVFFILLLLVFSYFKFCPFVITFNCFVFRPIFFFYCSYVEIVLTLFVFLSSIFSGDSSSFDLCIFV